MPIVLYISNGIICGYINGIHFCLYTKEASHHMSHEICHDPSYSNFRDNYYLIILYADNLPIIYANDYS